MEKFLVPASGVFRAQGAQFRGLDRSNCQADHGQPLDELQRAFSNDTKAVPEPSAMPAGSFAPPVPPEFRKRFSAISDSNLSSERWPDC
jgi:hypothetical protein